MFTLNFHQRTSYLYYFTEFINESRRAFLGALRLVYFLSIGLTLPQITLLYAIGQVMLLLFEFPTGAFADAFGRKKAVLLSFLIFSFSFFLTFFTQNYYYLIVLNALAVIGWTFQSGASDAWVIDTLGLSKETDTNGKDTKEKARTHLFSWHFIVGKAGWIIGGALGSVIAYFHLRSMWLALAVLHFFCFFVLLLAMKEKNFIPLPFRFRNIFSGIIKQSKEALHYSFTNKILLILLLLILLKGIPFSLFEVAWPVLFKEVLQIPVYYFGLIISLSTLFAVAGAYLAKKLSPKKGIPLTLFLFYLIFVLSAFGLGFSSLIFLAIGAFCFFQVGEGGTRPLAHSALHRYVPTDKRASILSLRSMLSGSGSMLGYLIAGPLVAFIGANFAMYALGSLILVLGLVHVITLWKGEKVS